MKRYEPGLFVVLLAIFQPSIQYIKGLYKGGKTYYEAFIAPSIHHHFG